jgi:hypothetical protein
LSVRASDPRGSDERPFIRAAAVNDQRTGPSHRCVAHDAAPEERTMEATYLPYHFVDHMTSPGLTTSAGTVKLNQYLCKTTSNGGNDSATSLYSKLRWMKDGGNGSTMNSLVGGVAVDLALKGQGSPSTFISIWNFMIRNKEQLKKLNVEVCARRDSKAKDTKVVLRKGNVYDLYFKTNTDRAALQAMVADRFFGIDCIGYTSTYLMFNGEWNEYKGATPAQWPMWHCKEKVNKASEIKPLDFLLWSGHIAIVDWVWGMVNADTVLVDVCQSSSGGPQCNEQVQLREMKSSSSGRRQFQILHRGQPSMPVHSHCVLGRRAGFFW